MTRKLTRNSRLSIVAAFIAILTLLTAAAVLAQVTDAGSSAVWSGGTEEASASRLQRNSPLLFLPVVNYGSGGQPAWSTANQAPFPLVYQDVGDERRSRRLQLAARCLILVRQFLEFFPPCSVSEEQL